MVVSRRKSFIKQRKIDRLVAENVMGWELTYYTTTDEPKLEGIKADGKMDEVPNYSTNIADAWQVVEKLIDKDYDFSIYNHNKEFNVEINIVEDDKHLWFYGEADSAPLAICLAALKAVGVEVEEMENGNLQIQSS